MRCFQLNTVKYGTACTPNLATKCLQHLALVARASQQLGAHAIQQNFYVDDCSSGADTLRDTIKQRDQICATLGSAKLKLRNWYSNHPELLKDNPKDDQALDLDFSKFSDATIKTLGIIWNPKEDKLQGRATTYKQGAVRKRIERARCPLSPAEPTDIQLHIFSDASEVAYVVVCCA